MKILVTGSQGFTGKNFIRHASSTGHEVIEIKTNLLDKEALIHEIRDLEFDTAINFAAISSVTHKDESEIYEVNVNGTRNFLDALYSSKTSSIKSIVLISSAHVYGSNTESYLTENHPLLPNTHYAKSKLSMELMSKTYMDKLPILIVRPFNYTGLGQSEDFVIPKVIKHYKDRLASIELGNIDTEREYNDIRFVCKAYLALLQYGQSGEAYNLCTGVTHSLRDVLATVTEITLHKIDIKITEKYKRKNDVKKLCGDPKKLSLVLSKAGVSLKDYSLVDTLTFMLDKEFSIE